MREREYKDRRGCLEGRVLVLGFGNGVGRGEAAGVAPALPSMIVYCSSTKSNFANQPLDSFLALSQHCYGYI